MYIHYTTSSGAGKMLHATLQMQHNMLQLTYSVEYVRHAQGRQL